MLPQKKILSFNFNNVHFNLNSKKKKKKRKQRRLLCPLLHPDYGPSTVWYTLVKPKRILLTLEMTSSVNLCQDSFPHVSTEA